MRILFATENRGKLREAEQILADTGLEVLPLSAAGVRSDPEEKINNEDSYFFFFLNILILCLSYGYRLNLP